AVDLVAHLPVLDPVRRRVAVGGAFGPPSGGGVAIAVLDQLCGALDAIRKTDTYERLDTHQLAELAELVHANVVGIDSPPVFVWPRHARIAIANAVLPPVMAGV